MMKLDVAPLIAASQRGTGNSLAEDLGCDRRQVTRWVNNGVPVDTADRLAVALGMHPAEVWGSGWWGAA